MKPLIPLADLRATLRFDPENGMFTWIIAPKGKPDFVGKLAGCDDGHGYKLIKLRQRIYRANRLAWYHYYGVWPEQEVDHWNGDRGDNSIGNLRLATRVDQLHNLHGPKSHNKSGYLGVSQGSANSWTAEINANGKRIKLGSFPTPELASAAYQNAKRKHHRFVLQASGDLSAAVGRRWGRHAPLPVAATVEHDDPDWRVGVPCDPDVIPF